MQRLKRAPNALPTLSYLGVAFTTLLALVSRAEANTFYLEGIGYREQALQQAKTSFFQSEDPNGILYASFGGGTNIFIRSPELNENPQLNQIYFTSVEFNNAEIPGRPLDEDDAFNSNPLLGFITYRLPAPHELFGVNQTNLEQYEELNFYLSVRAPDIFGEEQHLMCSTQSRCRVRFHRTYTPRVFYLSPPVLFYESYTQIFFDPKNTIYTVQNLKTDEMAFVNTEIGGSKLDFEYLVDSETSLSSWGDNQVMGRVGAMPIGHSNKDIKMLWEVGYGLVAEHESTHCTYNMDRCYQAMNVPVVFNISQHEGYTNGGQNLTIHGFGFNNPNVSVTVAGVDCRVTQFQDEYVSCEVQPSTAPSLANVSQAGAHGIRREFYNHTLLDWSNFNAIGVYAETLLTQFEAPSNIGDKLGNNMKAWFVAPETTKYRFHIACDDKCELNMGLDTTDPMNTTQIVSSLTTKSGSRKFFTQQSDAVSDWVDLVKDQKYYIQGRHYEGTGHDNFAVGVEIQQSAITNHHHSVKEVQYVEVKITDPTYDTTRVTVNNVAAGGTFYLAHQNPFNLTYTVSGKISVGATASTLRNQIKFYYRAIYGSEVDVNRTMFMQNGTETTNDTLAYTHTYHIRLMKLINGTSVANIQIIKSTSATIAVDLPTSVMTSSQPLSGKFRVTCPGPVNNDIASNPFYSNQIKVGEWSYWFARGIYLNCSGTYDKLEVWRDYTNKPYSENGVGYYVRFVGMNGVLPQMKIVSSSEDPLLGNYTISESKVVNSSTNIFYPAIPFEMLRTYESNPQVIVKVGDYPAVCKNLSCDYLYTIPVGEVTAYSYTASSRVLQLTGVDLPANISMIDYVSFGHSPCSISAATATSLTCTLVYEPVCGDHLPKLVSIYGTVNNSLSLTPETITCTVSSITPTTSLNLLGGDNLTFTGTQFPWNLETSTVDITFNDAQGTKCIPQTSTSIELVCLTSAFDQTISTSQTIAPTIVINSQTVPNTLSLSTMANTKSGMSLSPSSANPTLKTKINITLEADFPHILARADFSVNATNISNPSYFRQMNVIAVDDSTKTLTCMFGGAWSGLYRIDIRHKVFGLVESSGLQFTVGSNVTSYSPTSGSIYGGTLLTITGTNFGREFTDNPVQISTLGAVDSLDCFLKSISETQITCRLNRTTKEDGKQGKMIVFLKTSEESQCVPNSTCDWTYSATVPTVTAINPVWDSTNNYWTVVVDGTGFTGTAATTDLEVNGRTQTTISVTSTQAVFKVSNITGWVLSNMNVYFDVGTPAGHDTVVDGKLFALSPKLVSISPNVGSIGGSLLVAQLEGLGEVTGTTPSGDLVDMATGNSICQTFKVRSYGVVECLTIPGTISTGTVIGGKSLYSFEKSACSNTNSALCAYEQVSGSSMPVISSVSNSPSDTIVFTGTDFFTSGYTGHASYDGIAADTVTINSATQATAVWTYGLPSSGTAIQPNLWFNQTGTDIVHYASSTSTITKSLSNVLTSDGTQCSFAGGCNFIVFADGLSTILKNDSANNYITVCDEKCEFDEIQSSSSLAVCKVPPISTVYSNENFKIETTSEDLRFRQIFGNLANNQLVFDNHLTVRPTISGQSECYVGGSFKAGHIGMLSQVKYFMGDIQDKTKYVSHLKFQGSNDNSSWTDLFAADDNVHEGWNYHKWETVSAQPKYRFYRFHNSNNSQGCDINEMKMTGVETVDDSSSTYTCQVTVQKNNMTLHTISNTVTYTGALTPKLESMNPRFGTVTGGTSVTFTGTNFVSDTSKYTIIIDGRTCVVTGASTTDVTCTTDHRPGLISPSLKIYIDGYGLVANQQQLFRYVSMWSDDTTWGGEFAPMYGESVYVPEGLNLMIDVDRTPELNLVMVEGALIFAPDANPLHERFFDANYIFLHNAYMEVGTETYPYTSKLTITMHGNISSPYLPVFGNKCLAVKQSTLDMHGIARTPTWTVLHETALPGATQIKLSGAVDWNIGEEIAIASTSFDGREGEKRVITAIDTSTPSIPVITLDRPLDFKHFAMIQSYGSDSIDMRAEVGLLTRNVKFRGDPETSFANEYGATIFLHSEGDDSLVARLEYIELTDVGQAFKVGRYAVHFHMIGAVHKSYCKGFGTHQGFNRAFTLHGTHYLRLIENVAYDIKGHTIFIEDAVEKKNYIYKNLIMKTKRSWSLLNTDQTPACFWITNPDNSFIENHAAGSDRYGYWYDLQTHAIGPHANTNVCPENERVGEFRDNHAHSCGRYGLRIFHNMIPRQFPCKPVVYDHSNLDDPWWQNPPITAHFYRLTSWKNGRNGAIAEKVGDVRFHDFKVADNKLAGIEFSLTDDYGDNTTRIDNALIIGKTNNTEEALEISQPYGIIGPRTENFRVDGVRFFNFDWNNASALSSCSHCFHPAATDSGARTIRFSNLTFDSSVTRIANYQYPWRAIFFDEDGTLTGKGPHSWATPYYPHHNQTGCEHNELYYGGTFCDSSVQVRRVAFSGAKPAGLFAGMGFKILRYDDDIVAEYGNKTEYLLNQSHYSTMFFKKKLDPGNGWATPFVTGHKYKIHFGMTGLDYEELTIDASERWEPTDKPIYFVHNWTDVRMAIDFRVGGSNGYLVENNTIPADQNDWHIGHNVVYNETDVRETHFVISGKNESNPYNKQRLHHKGHRCIGSCNEYIDENVPAENFTRYWANATDWPSGKVPEAGEDVHIEPGWNMIFNMNPSPIYKLIRVNGNLTFDNVTDTHLQAKHIFVRAGELHIGSQEYPMQMNAKITLFGEKNMETIVYDNAIEAGNKLIANVNKVRMYGKQRSWKMTRLLKPALKDSNTFTVQAGLEIYQGDRLALLPTSYDSKAFDDVFVESYDSASGLITINSTLNFYHWGQEQTTGYTHNGLDMRGEVLLLTRNVKIYAEDIESWGGQFVTSDTVEIFGEEIIQRQGTTILDSVEIFNCSQIDTFKAALRFQSASQLHSSVTNSAVHNGYAWGIHVTASANINIKDNIFFSFRPIGAGIRSSRNITFDNNIVGGIVDRTTLETGDMVVDKAGGVSICAYDEGDASCTDIYVRNNIVGGSTYGGFVTYGHPCGDYSSKFEGNVAHSINGGKSGNGLYFKNHPSESECTEYSNFFAYKCYYQGVFAYPKSKRVILSKMTMVDNKQGAGSSIVSKGNEYDNSYVDITYNDFKIYGEYGSPDCPQNRQGGFCFKVNKYGMLSALGTWKGKDFHITAASALPPFKIKSIASWVTRVEIHRTEFINFRAFTEEGMRQRAYELNPYASDSIPMQEFYDTTFENIEDEALGLFFEPPQGWAIIKDCGNFPCTAPKNTLYSFKRNLFKGLRPSYAAENFQMIPDTPAFSEYVPNCERWTNMNLWTCKEDRMGILYFESEDSDTLDRSMQPIYTRLQGTGMNNKVNSFMDHVWDGFYTGQLRLSRFPIIVYAPWGAVYDVVYTGSPAKRMKYTLRSQERSLGLTVRIAYPSAESRQILKDGQRVDMNQWDETERMYGPVKQRFCGENRYIGVKNILEFYLTQGCTLQIAPRDAIQTMVRLEWTMAEFFDNGGTTKFVDRVAGSLGIHASTIKVVSVYEGSVVVNYDILAADDDTKPELTLKRLSDKQIQKYSTGQMDLGAPILDVQTSITKSSDTTSATVLNPIIKVVKQGVVSAPGYDPLVLTKVDPVQSGSEDVYIPDIPFIQQTNNTQGSQATQGSQGSSGSNTQQLDSQPSIVTNMNKYENNKIVNIDDKDITIIQGNGQTAMIIIIIGVVVVFIIALVLGIRFLLNRLRAEQATAEHIRQTQKNLNKDTNIKVIPRNKDGVNKEDFDQVVNTESPDKVERAQRKGNQLEFLEEQYDPNQEFKIFGVGDKTKGGVQSLQQKMNMADNQNSDRSSDDEQQQNNKANDSELRSSNNSNAKLMRLDESALGNPQSQNSPKSSLKASQLADNALPEDQEIQNDE